jgi:hypothetical protein
MSLHVNKAAAFFEQLLSSLFNFSIIVVLSNIPSSSVSSYGLVYSFALIYIALLKNGALNIFLTDGRRCFLFFMDLVFKVFRSFYSFCFLFFVFIYVLFFSTELSSYLMVFLFYVIVELNRVYLFSIKKELLNLMVNAFCYLMVLLSVYYRLADVVFSFSIAFFFQLILFLFLFKIGFCYKREGDASKGKSIGLGGSSFILTLSYSMYAHGPLWVLYIVDDGMAKMFLQIRNLFQPVQMISRVVDLYEKRSSGQEGYSYEIFKKKLFLNFLFVAPLSFFVFIVGSVTFNYIYGVEIDSLEVTLIFVYSLVCVFTFLSKPVETWFYKIKDLGPIIKSRVIASVLFLLSVPFFVFFNSEFTLLILLAYLGFIWGFVLLRNIIVVMSLKNISFH